MRSHIVIISVALALLALSAIAPASCDWNDLPTMYKINQVYGLRIPLNPRQCKPSNEIKCSPDGQYITELHLSAKQMHGALLSEFGEFSQLTRLDVSNNYLTGTIPTFLAKLRNIVSFNFENNAFRGTMPQAILDLPYLSEFFMKDNNMIGTIPKEFSSAKADRKLKQRSWKPQQP